MEGIQITKKIQSNVKPMIPLTSMQYPARRILTPIINSTFDKQILDQYLARTYDRWALMSLFFLEDLDSEDSQTIINETSIFRPEIIFHILANARNVRNFHQDKIINSSQIFQKTTGQGVDHLGITSQEHTISSDISLVNHLLLGDKVPTGLTNSIFLERFKFIPTVLKATQTVPSGNNALSQDSLKYDLPRNFGKIGEHFGRVLNPLRYSLGYPIKFSLDYPGRFFAGHPIGPGKTDTGNYPSVPRRFFNSFSINYLLGQGQISGEIIRNIFPQNAYFRKRSYASLYSARLKEKNTGLSLSPVLLSTSLLDRSSLIYRDSDTHGLIGPTIQSNLMLALKHILQASLDATPNPVYRPNFKLVFNSLFSTASNWVSKNNLLYNMPLISPQEAEYNAEINFYGKQRLLRAQKSKERILVSKETALPREGREVEADQDHLVANYSHMSQFFSQTLNQTNVQTLVQTFGQYFNQSPTFDQGLIKIKGGLEKVLSGDWSLRNTKQYIWAQNLPEVQSAISSSVINSTNLKNITQGTILNLAFTHSVLGNKDKSLSLFTRSKGILPLPQSSMVSQRYFSYGNINWQNLTYYLGEKADFQSPEPSTINSAFTSLMHADFVRAFNQVLQTRLSSVFKVSNMDSIHIQQAWNHLLNEVVFNPLIRSSIITSQSPARTMTLYSSLAGVLPRRISPGLVARLPQKLRDPRSRGVRALLVDTESLGGTKSLGVEGKELLPQDRNLKQFRIENLSQNLISSHSIQFNPKEATANNYLFDLSNGFEISKGFNQSIGQNFNFYFAFTKLKEFNNLFRPFALRGQRSIQGPYKELSKQTELSKQQDGLSSQKLSGFQSRPSLLNLIYSSHLDLNMGSSHYGAFSVANPTLLGPFAKFQGNYHPHALRSLALPSIEFPSVAQPIPAHSNINININTWLSNGPEKPRRSGSSGIAYPFDDSEGNKVHINTHIFDKVMTRPLPIKDKESFIRQILNAPLLSRSFWHNTQFNRGFLNFIFHRSVQTDLGQRSITAGAPPKGNQQIDVIHIGTSPVNKFYLNKPYFRPFDHNKPYLITFNLSKPYSGNIDQSKSYLSNFDQNKFYLNTFDKNKSYLSTYNLSKPYLITFNLNTPLLNTFNTNTPYSSTFNLSRPYFESVYFTPNFSESTRNNINISFPSIEKFFNQSNLISLGLRGETSNDLQLKTAPYANRTEHRISGILEKITRLIMPIGLVNKERQKGSKSGIKLVERLLGNVYRTLNQHHMENYLTGKENFEKGIAKNLLLTFLKEEGDENHGAESNLVENYSSFKSELEKIQNAFFIKKFSTRNFNNSNFPGVTPDGDIHPTESQSEQRSGDWMTARLVISNTSQALGSWLFHRGNQESQVPLRNKAFPWIEHGKDIKVSKELRIVSERVDSVNISKASEVLRKELLIMKNQSLTLSNSVAYKDREWVGPEMIILAPPVIVQDYNSGYVKNLPPITYREEEMQPYSSKKSEPITRSLNTPVEISPATMKQSIQNVDLMNPTELNRLVDKVYSQLETRLKKEKRRFGF